MNILEAVGHETLESHSSVLGIQLLEHITQIAEDMSRKEKPGALNSESRMGLFSTDIIEEIFLKSLSAQVVTRREP